VPVCILLVFVRLVDGCLGVYNETTHPSLGCCCQVVLKSELLYVDFIHVKVDIREVQHSIVEKKSLFSWTICAICSFSYGVWWCCMGFVFISILQFVEFVL
jgi:hypothetical protein